MCEVDTGVVLWRFPSPSFWKGISYNDKHQKIYLRRVTLEQHKLGNTYFQSYHVIFRTTTFLFWPTTFLLWTVFNLDTEMIFIKKPLKPMCSHLLNATPTSIAHLPWPFFALFHLLHLCSLKKNVLTLCIHAVRNYNVINTFQCWNINFVLIIHWWVFLNLTNTFRLFLFKIAIASFILIWSPWPTLGLRFFFCFLSECWPLISPLASTSPHFLIIK